MALARLNEGGFQFGGGLVPVFDVRLDCPCHDGVDLSGTVYGPPASVVGRALNHALVRSARPSPDTDSPQSQVASGTLARERPRPGRPGAADRVDGRLVARQRCIVHRTWNVLARVPKKRQEEVEKALHRIIYAASLEDAQLTRDAQRVRICSANFHQIWDTTL